MSTTSCPRCTGQVTLPVGVKNDATVRCPLCHAHYTLADALVNMPPILEVVENADEALAADSFDAPPVDRVGEPIAAAEPPPAELAEPEFAEPEFAEVDDDLLGKTIEASADDGDVELGGLDFDEEEPEDFVAQEKDTDVEDLTFSTFDSPRDLPESPPLGAETETFQFDDAEDVEAKVAADAADNRIEDDDLALDFGEPAQADDGSEAETLDFGAELEAEEADAEDEVKFNIEPADAAAGESATLDFGGAVTQSDDDVEFDLEEPGEPAASDAATISFGSDGSDGEEVQFDFDEPAAENGDSELRNFEDIRVEPTGQGEDIPLDVPGESAPAVAVAGDDAAEADGKKKGKKKKKEKKPKAAKPAGAKDKRSLVGTLVSVVLPAIIAVPVALYGLVWISPGLDVLGLGKILPSAMLPADMNKTNRPLAQTYTPPAVMPTEEPAQPEPLTDEATPGEPVEPSTEEPSTSDGAAGETTPHTAARLPTEEPATEEAMPAEDAAPSLAPPTDAAAEPEPAPAAAADSDPFGDISSPAAPAEAMPAEEMPAETPGEEKPAEGGDPFDSLLAPEPAEKPADDLFAPATEAKPAASPAEMPAKPPSRPIRLQLRPRSRLGCRPCNSCREAGRGRRSVCSGAGGKTGRRFVRSRGRDKARRDAGRSTAE